MSLMGISEFAKRSWLSRRALRLYDELGLLPPARVDADSGYRWYAPEQLDRARLVASLRRLEIPLARIKAILAQEAAAAARQVAAYWAEAETSHAARRELAGYLIGRLNGKEPVMYEVTIRDMPERHVLCALRHAHTAEHMAATKDLMARLGPVAKPQPGDPVTAPFVVYHGEVSEDSDGPVEYCWPVPAEKADELAAQFADLTLRTEPAHEEAFVDVGQVALGQTNLEPVIEGLVAWISARERQASGGLRQILMFNPPSGGQGTALQWGFALRPAQARAAR
ncbi:MAG TPA: MerR family transcriptional regulator [Streptosporangiaceae bacterium]|nr:MerR family transcriptional regulator [Streptosporangiaceae bacterium]